MCASLYNNNDYGELGYNFTYFSDFASILMENITKKMTDFRTNDLIKLTELIKNPAERGRYEPPKSNSKIAELRPRALLGTFRKKLPNASG